MIFLKDEQGYSLLISFFTIIFISILGVGLFSLTTNSMKNSMNERMDQSIYYVAESGINFKLEEINVIVEEEKLTALQLLNAEIERVYNANKNNPSSSISQEELYNFYKNTLNNLVKSRLNLTSNPETLNNLLSATPEGEVPKIEILINETTTPFMYEIISKGRIKNTGSRILKATFSIEVDKSTFLLDYSATEETKPQNPNDNQDSYPITEEVGDKIVPIFTFSGGEFNVGNNNWEINGNKTSKNDKFEMLTSKNIALLNTTYEYHKNSCSNTTPVNNINKPIIITENTTFYINAPTLTNELLDVAINNPNGKEVNIVYCNVTEIDKNPSFNIKENVGEAKKNNTNVFVVSKENIKLDAKNVHGSNLITNIFYAPNLTIDKINGKIQNFCTTFYVDKFELGNGAGGTLSNACTGTLPKVDKPTETDKPSIPKLKNDPYINLLRTETLEI